jgi:hypothetical protein
MADGRLQTADGRLKMADCGWKADNTHVRLSFPNGPIGNPDRAYPDSRTLTRASVSAPPGPPKTCGNDKGKKGFS